MIDPDILAYAFLLFGGIGAGGVLLHYLGYIPRPYRDRLEATETTLTTHLTALPAAMGVELESAMDRFAARQKAEMVTDGQVNSQLLNAAKNFKLNDRHINEALTEAILGPALPILRQFAPSLADMLESNPQLVDVVINNPLFKKYIEPRIQQFLGSQQGGHLSVESGGWGT